jgi:hypothetical protein
MSLTTGKTKRIEAGKSLPKVVVGKEYQVNELNIKVCPFL